MFCKIDAYGNPTVPGLLSLAGQMKMGRGLLMAVGLLEGDMVEVSPPPPPAAMTPVVAGSGWYVAIAVSDGRLWGGWCMA